MDGEVGKEERGEEDGMRSFAPTVVFKHRRIVTFLIIALYKYSYLYSYILI